MSAAPQSRPGGPGLRDLVALARPHRRRFALGVLLAVTATAGSLVQPQLVRRLVDALSAAEPVTGVLVVLVVVTVAAAVVSGFQAYVTHRAAHEAAHGQRVAMTDRLLRMTVRDHDRSNSADLLSRAISDTDVVAQALAMGVVPVLAAVIALVGTTVLMAAVDLVLFAITVGCVVVGVVLVAAVTRSAKHASFELQSRTGLMSVALERILSGIRTIKSFRAEADELVHLEAASDRMRHSAVRLARIQAVVQPAINLCIQGAIVLVVVVGAGRVAGGELTLGALLAYLMYLFMVLSPISALSQGLTALNVGVAAYQRLDELAAMPVEGADDPSPASPGPELAKVLGSPRTSPTVTLEDVSFGYDPAHPALDGVSLEIPPGARVAIVGRSGSGKTTVLELLERFYDPDRGTVRVDGVDTRTLTHDEVRSLFALVTQEGVALTGTLRENISVGSRDLPDEVLVDALRRVGLVDLLGKDAFDLDTDLGQGGVTLSGGQRQRLGWVRMLLSDAPVLLMDEPTANLDAVSELELQRLVEEFAGGRSIVTVSHRPAAVRRADVVHVLDGGRVVASGDPARLAEGSELFRDLVTGSVGDASVVDAPAERPALVS